MEENSIVKKIMKSFRMLLIQTFREGILFVILLAPLLIGILFKFVIPEVNVLLSKEFNEENILTSYYPLFDLLLAVLTPYMFSSVASMTMLDEYDSNIINHISITPIKKSGYLISRLVIPTIFAFVVTIFMLFVFTISKWNLLEIVIVSFLTSIMSISLALIMFSFSKNKTEGMAIAKLSGLLAMGIFIPYFISDNIQYVFGIFPSLWIAKYFQSGNLLYAMFAIILLIVWILPLYHKFTKKLS